MMSPIQRQRTQGQFADELDRSAMPCPKKVEAQGGARSVALPQPLRGRRPRGQDENHPAMGPRCECRQKRAASDPQSAPLLSNATELSGSRKRTIFVAIDAKAVQRAFLLIPPDLSKSRGACIAVLAIGDGCHNDIHIPHTLRGDQTTNAQDLIIGMRGDNQHGAALASPRPVRHPSRACHSVSGVSGVINC